MSIATPPVTFPEQHVVLRGVSWAFYQRTLEEVGNQRLRITYDRGRMEIMSPGQWHDNIKKIIARLLEMYAVERDIPITGLGSTTCQHEKLKHGIEPDECYYITTPLPPMGIGPLDLTIHAPPDLAVEVDVTSSSIPRQPIYGALGVPEVWRFDGTRVVPLHRQVDGTYRPAERSLAFPDLPMTEFNRFLAMALTTGPNSQHAQHAAVVALRDWARR